MMRKKNLDESDWVIDKLNMQLSHKTCNTHTITQNTTASNEFDNHNTMYIARLTAAQYRVRLRLGRVSHSPVGGSCRD